MLNVENEENKNYPHSPNESSYRKCLVIGICGTFAMTQLPILLIDINCLWRLGKSSRRRESCRRQNFGEDNCFHHTSPFHTTTQATFAMIKRALLRQSRSLTSHVTSRSISQLHPSLRPRNVQPLASIFAKPLPPRLGARWQSTEADAEAKTNPTRDPIPSEEAKAAQAEDPVKQELEAKNKEIIELKVCHTSTGYLEADVISLLCRTDTSAPSPISVTSRSAQSATSSQRAISPSRNSQPTSSNQSTTSTAPYHPYHLKR